MFKKLDRAGETAQELEGMPCIHKTPSGIAGCPDHELREHPNSGRDEVGWGTKQGCYMGSAHWPSGPSWLGLSPGTPSTAEKTLLIDISIKWTLHHSSYYISVQKSLYCVMKSRQELYKSALLNSQHVTDGHKAVASYQACFQHPRWNCTHGSATFPFILVLWKWVIGLLNTWQLSISLLCNNVMTWKN